MSDEPDLSILDTEAMIDELRKRFDAFILVAEYDEAADNGGWRQHWDGSPSRVLGMMMRAQKRFIVECDKLDVIEDNQTE